MSEFERVSYSMGLKIYVGKSKMLTIKKDQMGSCEKVRVNGEELQEVDKFNYLGVMISMDGGMEERQWFTGYLREERFRGKAPQIHNLAGLLGIERRGKILNGRDREVCRENEIIGEMIKRRMG